MEVILVKPRGFCAGVVRAIEIVVSALDLYGSPIYVLHEIVHNQRVMADLETRGARFVEALEGVPSGATVIFSAHGVSSAMGRRAAAQGLKVIDATCPLVTKVHLEVARHARAGREVVLIGHAGHPEVNGTIGRYDRGFGGEVYLVETLADVDALAIRNPLDVAYVTQTTLSLDDARRIVAALEARYPRIRGPRRADICYATQNRQNAVRALAGYIDLLLVVGARNSSNSNRLREVGAQIQVPSYLLQDADELDVRWLEGKSRVGVSAGASTPEILVQSLLARLRALGAVVVREAGGPEESVTFRIPEGLQRAAKGNRDEGRPGNSDQGG
ncbi:MAG: 4-hydroxy-3-methylbut-2-enyl diphosphate reductase [Betaproteobacteria bacterium]|nr:4-hydroxy-3-methylbut-2-enyl diphosphate reductase [Betaproteobacteria bacterium]